MDLTQIELKPHIAVSCGKCGRAGALKIVHYLLNTPEGIAAELGAPPKRSTANLPRLPEAHPCPPMT